MAANEITTALGRVESRAGSIVSVTPGKPTEQLQVSETIEEEVQYPSGPQVFLNVGAMMLVCVSSPSSPNDYLALGRAPLVMVPINRD